VRSHFTRGKTLGAGSVKKASAEDEAVFSFDLPSEYAEAFLRALEPETRVSVTPRTKVRVNLKGNVLTLRFKSQGISALMAAINSYLRLINLLINTFKYMDESSVFENL
jgi:tRNA threonylcarbamoyladenosine modification (KEOPS) complex  Pcc1 subunit